jgi:hypothetical protein
MSQTTIDTFFAELPTKTSSASNAPWINLNVIDGQSAQVELFDRDAIGILVALPRFRRGVEASGSSRHVLEGHR